MQQTGQTKLCVFWTGNDHLRELFDKQSLQKITQARKTAGFVFLPGLCHLKCTSKADNTGNVFRTRTHTSLLATAKHKGPKPHTI